MPERDAFRRPHDLSLAERDGRPDWRQWLLIALAWMGAYLALQKIAAKARRRTASQLRSGRADFPLASAGPVHRPAPAAPWSDAAQAERRRQEASLPPEEECGDDGRITHPRVRYQVDEAPTGWVLAIMIGAICFAGFQYGASYWFFRDHARHEAKEKASLFSASIRPVERLPVEPRLEQLDRLEGVQRPDESRRQRIEEANLDAYAATDEHGFVRVPIVRAMEYLAGGLPIRKDERDQRMRDRGLVNSGDSNSGRLFRDRP